MANSIFLGLKPYTEDDAYRFKGRTEESQELFRMIMRNDFTVCYAESGEGKTSLLNAGVFPLLRQNRYFPISIIFTKDDYKKTPDNFDTIIDRCIKDSIAEYNNKNKGVNVEYKLSSTDFQNLDCRTGLQQELSQYSWWYLRNYKPQAMGLIFTPVFVFDQFEEVFYLPNSIVWTKKFFDWLEEVSSDSCPDKIIKKVRSIIGDKAAFPIIKEEKGFNVIFSLRKEFIGELDYWGMQKSFIPSLKDNRYCLKALTYNGAELVMTQQECFEKFRIKQVVNYLVQKYSQEPQKTVTENLPVIPALLLSVVCESWEKDIESFSDMDVNEIGSSLNIILQHFYDDALTSITNELQQDCNRQNELIREDVETALFALIDSNGKRVRRKSSELSYLDFDTKYKKVLSNKRIIKISKVDDEDYVEIIHDVLCPIIAHSKELRLVAETKEKRRKSNLNRFLSQQNPLNLGGRRIWDNKNFSFSVDNSRSYSLNNSSYRTNNSSYRTNNSSYRTNNSSYRTDVLKDLLLDDNGVEQLFFEKLFTQATGPGKIILTFSDNCCCKDGISAFEIETERVWKQLRIKRVDFKDSNKNAFYIADGFCGIICEYYNDTGYEFKRKYLCDGYTSVGIVAIKFENYNEYGFPTKISYFDDKDNPCKHIDGNYGVQIEYDDYGHETCRWFLDQSGEKVSIYNGVYGIVSQYDELDRVIKQYFVDKERNCVFDDYGFHGIKIEYNEAPNELLVSKIIYIDRNNSPCNNPQGFCIEHLQYDDRGRIIWQLYYDKDGNEIGKKDGTYFYSRMKIDYNEQDKPFRLEMYDLYGNSLKVHKYTYNKNGSINECSFYESKQKNNGLIERKSKFDNSSVHRIVYTPNNHGVLIRQEYFDEYGNSTKDANDYNKIDFIYNRIGNLIEICFYNSEKSQNEPIRKSIYKQYHNGKSEMIDLEYEITTASPNIWEKVSFKEIETHAVEKKKTLLQGILNHRNEFVKIYLDENNDYISGTPLTVRKKYDIEGNVVEELLYDKDDRSPICDKDGVYGWRVKYDVITEEHRIIEFLGSNSKIANNKYHYAIIKYTNEMYEGITYPFVTSYFDEDNKPALCEQGFHKMLESAYSYNDELYKQVVFVDCSGELCDSANGYSRQRFEEERDGSELKLTVSFWGADGTQRKNQMLGYHKREQLFYTEKEPMERIRTFKDENDNLINIGEGFAKETFKRYDSLLTLFHYPFTDYKVIRFYDKNEQKVDADFYINGNKYHAYKFIVSLDWPSSCKVFKVTTMVGKTLHYNCALLWKYINVIWIPPIMLLAIVIYLLFSVLKWLYNLCKPKQGIISKSTTIIQIVQIYDTVQNGEESIQAPIKQYDVKEGSWIVRWNQWTYNTQQDVATAFETEFNNSSERRKITFYNPNEKEFLDVDIPISNIGLKLQDAQVPIEEVEEMIRKWDTSKSQNR